MSTLNPFFGGRAALCHLFSFFTHNHTPSHIPSHAHGSASPHPSFHRRRPCYQRILASMWYWCRLCCVDSAVLIRLWRFGCIDWSADLTVVICNTIQLQQYVIGLRRFVCCMIAWLFGCCDATNNSYLDCWIDSAVAIYSSVAIRLRWFVCCMIRFVCGNSSVWIWLWRFGCGDLYAVLAVVICILYD